MKAILVMEMPENCSGCLLNDYMSCKVRPTIGITILPQTGRPNGCPLKSLPKRNQIKAICSEAYEDGVTDGWNACIDVIEGRK